MSSVCHTHTKELEVEETKVFPFWKEDSRYTRVNYHHLELWSVDNLDQQYHEYLYTRNPYYLLGDILVSQHLVKMLTISVPSADYLSKPVFGNTKFS